MAENAAEDALDCQPLAAVRKTQARTSATGIRDSHAAGIPRGCMKKRRNPKVTNPNPILVPPETSRGRWDVLDARSKLVRADLTRREAASLLGSSGAPREGRGVLCAH